MMVHADGAEAINIMFLVVTEPAGRRPVKFEWERASNLSQRIAKRQ